MNDARQSTPPQRDDERKRLLLSLNEDERRLLAAILKIEREYLHMQRPRGIKDDLIRVVKEVIK